MSSSLDIIRLRENIREHYLADESLCVNDLLKSIKISPLELQNIELFARDLVNAVRQNSSSKGTVEAFIHEYSLSSEEGIILMCLAEALLRIPDDITADRLIKNKLALAEFEAHLSHSHSLFVNASTWGLMLTGKLVNIAKGSSFAEQFVQLITRLGEPMLRNLLRQAMKIMASQYVMGKDIETALLRGKKEFQSNCRFSYDMLGESALSKEDAFRYFNAYKQAIEKISLAINEEEWSDSAAAPSISIKLSALHPRYEISKIDRIENELIPTLLSLVQFARAKHVAVTLDAEEADRLELSLTIVEKLIFHDSLNGWDGFGLAVQAYQKRAFHVLKWLKSVAIKLNKIIPVRLVKGAYWDTEIKRAQEQGLSGYPVFTRKSNTDVSYITCSMFLLNNSAHFYPQFATHNAHTLATICQFVTHETQFEFQRLHGMGERLHDQLINDFASRVYSPVGNYQDLLPYLVRRLLENGANSSFVNRIENTDVPINEIVKSPMDVLSHVKTLENPNIPLPANIFPNRRNSQGLNLGDVDTLRRVQEKIEEYKTQCWFLKEKTNKSREVCSPSDNKHIVGFLNDDSAAQLKSSIALTVACIDEWRHVPIITRIEIIRTISKLLQENSVELYALCVFEAGKTIKDSVAEVREAIDFCEYYVAQAMSVLSEPVRLKGPVGEDNDFLYQGRGLFVCISPWNFPVAIFVGQVVAALITGNVVIAKASSHTSLVAKRLVELFYLAGLPNNVLTLVYGSGRVINDVLLSDTRVSGVAFTGSFETARKINLTLASRRSPIVPLIAETGGLNAMIVDSSALPEQVVKDVISSAFLSAGQRCSALRVLIVQSDIIKRIEALLVNAMNELQIGEPGKYSTDIPPVITDDAMKLLNAYRQSYKKNNGFIYEVPVPETLVDKGYFVSPTLLKIVSLSELDKEMFGPILHLMPFEADAMDQLIDEINRMGYGLTLGIHSRIDETIEHIATAVSVGNIYINRNMVGAVVGVQPFGGEGYSGTGPKAGGPNYLQRFCTEKTITTNTAAIGGNMDLLTMSEGD